MRGVCGPRCVCGKPLLDWSGFSILFEPQCVLHYQTAPHAGKKQKTRARGDIMRSSAQHEENNIYIYIHTQCFRDQTGQLTKESEKTT